MKVTVRYEALNARNESTRKTFDIDSGELALMIETDSHERAQQSGKPIEDMKPRHPQDIVDELWIAEEKVNHEFHRGDRGKGRKICTCGARCGERRGCRVPESFPWTLDRMIEENREPADFETTPENIVIAAEESRWRAADLVAMRTAVATLSDRHQMLVELMTEQGMTQADVARHLDLSRARVSQLFRDVKTTVIEAVKLSRLNTSGDVGSEVRGLADGAGPRPEKGN